MQVLSTFSQLEPDPLFQDLELSVFRLQLRSVSGQSAGIPIEMPLVKTMLVSHTHSQGYAEALELILAAELEPASASKIQDQFALTEALAAGLNAYCFRMKTKVLARYGPDYVASTDLAAWLAFGEGAFLNLANYDLIGYYSFQ